MHNQWGFFVQQAAAFNPAEMTTGPEQYTRENIEQIDLLEKKRIPVYNLYLPQKGIYADYEDFKNNAPTETVFIKEVDKRTQKPTFYEV